jgi:hypothetical protein
MGDRHGNALFCSVTCSKAFKNAAYYARHRDRLRAKNLEYRQAHIEEARVRDAAYYALMKSDPEFRRKRMEYGRAYYLANREDITAYGAWYRATYPDKWAAKNAAWAAANPDKRRNYRAKRRALELAAYVEDVDRQTVWERDGGICHICGTAANPDQWDLEHIIPLAKGGFHSYANTAVSHPLCNKRKGAKLI